MCVSLHVCVCVCVGAQLHLEKLVTHFSLASYRAAWVGQGETEFHKR